MPFLKMGVTSAHFRHEGKVPDCTQVLKVVCRKSAKISALPLITLIGISLSCEAFDVFKDFISVKISN